MYFMHVALNAVLFTSVPFLWQLNVLSLLMPCETAVQSQEELA